MIDRRAVVAEILARKSRAKQYAQVLMLCRGGSRAAFDDAFRGYLCAKFFLAPEELDTDDLYRICQYSVEKASRLPPGAIDAAEQASKCGGATTATNKKVLFMLALQCELGVELSVEESVGVDTLSGLIGLVYQKMEARHDDGGSAAEHS